MRKNAEALAVGPIEPWVLDLDGKRRLPIFSREKRITVFSGEISKRLNKVFSLGFVEVLMSDIVDKIVLDFIDLNLFSPKSWEIQIKK